MTAFAFDRSDLRVHFTLGNVEAIFFGLTSRTTSLSFDSSAFLHIML